MLADLVAGAAWAGEAFVEDERFRHKNGELWLVEDAGFQVTEALYVLVGPGSRECDVGMVWARFRNESAGCRCRCDVLLEEQECGGSFDIGEEDSGSIEKT